MPRPALLAAFEHRNYRLLWIGAFISSVGSWMQDVALSWWIHERLADPVYLGLRSFAAEAPLLAFMAIGGAVADRSSRRAILLASNGFQMSMALLLGILYLTGGLGVGAILVIAFATGLAQSQSAPTYQAVLTSIVPRQRIPNAVSLTSLQFNLSRAIGPVLAGLLLARLGAGACFLVNALSFVAVVLALTQISLPAAAAPVSEGLGRSLRAGFAHVWSDPLLRELTLLAAIGSMLAFPLITYLPTLAGDVLGTGAQGYATLLACFGIGAIVGALTTASRGHAPRRGRVMLVALCVFGAATTVAVLSARPLVAGGLLFLAGIGAVTAFSTLNSLVQEHTPENLKGRVLSIYGLAFRGGSPVGSVVAGLFARRFGVGLTLASAALLLLLVSLGLLVRGGRLARV